MADESGEFERLVALVAQETAVAEDMHDLRDVALAADRAGQAEAMLRAAILVSRGHGRSWRSIALAIGIDRATARTRYGSVTDRVD